MCISNQLWKQNASAIDEHPGLQEQHPRAKQRNCSAFTQAKFTCTTRRSFEVPSRGNRETVKLKKTQKPKEDLDSQKPSFHETPVG